MADQQSASTTLDEARTALLGALNLAAEADGPPKGKGAAKLKDRLVREVPEYDPELEERLLLRDELLDVIGRIRALGDRAS